MRSLATWILAASTVLIPAVLTPSRASAQIAGYATLTNTTFSFGSESCSAYSFLCFSGSHPDPEDGNPTGVGAGIFYDLPLRSRFKAGLDLRGTVTPGSTGGGTFTASARFSVVPHHNRLRPYLQAGIGVASAHTTSVVAPLFGPVTAGPTVSASNATFIAGFGLDIRLTQLIDLRAFDFSAGPSLSTATGSSFTVDPLSLSIGVVFHPRLGAGKS